MTLSLSRHIDTALLAQPPPAGSKLPRATVPAAPLASGPSGSTANGGGEGGPSTAAHAAQKKAAGQRHTWSLIVRLPKHEARPRAQRLDADRAAGFLLQGLNSPTPYLKVNNTIFKGQAMESVESEMILRMKKPRRKGRTETEEDQWGAPCSPLSTRPAL